MSRYLSSIANAPLMTRYGNVTDVSGLSVESVGFGATLGETCVIKTAQSGQGVQLEVVGLQGNRSVLMPFGRLDGVRVGDTVTPTGRRAEIGVGDALIGRVIDPFGQPLDDGPPIQAGHFFSLYANAPDPLRRPRIDTRLETGTRVIDTLLPLGRGQRVGIFSGSGVGKSTLLGMVACNVAADVNVIALIGERGREVRDFIDTHLGSEGLARSVVVVATSDQSALLRARAAYASTAIAEYFRGLGRHVLLTMDSVTRFAMARRDIGLASGEPPTARGYTPSVFNEISRLCERSGTHESGGSVTALYTVLVEGDDFNEPISDYLRATLDGHIILTREMSHEGQFPAVDPLQSISRLMQQVSTDSERAIVAKVIDCLSCYKRNQSLIELGAYREGSNAELDRAVRLYGPLRAFFKQAMRERAAAETSFAALAGIFAKVDPI